jgi:hypothetical protein
MCVLNITFNLAYYFFNHRFMFKRNTPFFSFPRIFMIFFLSQLLQEQFLIKYVAMNNYRVNINDLLDQDEEFLFENPHFCALIRKIKMDFEYLVNPIFDLEEIMKRANPIFDAKYMKSATDGWNP